MPTIHGLVNEDLTHQVDGIDLFNNSLDLSQRPIFWKTDHNKVVIKDGWKLQVAETPDKKWLFNLNDDPTEQNELSASYPDKVKELLTLIDQHSDGGREAYMKHPCEHELKLTELSRNQLKILIMRVR